MSKATDDLQPASEVVAVSQPILETGRLVLRPFRAGDAAMVQELAGDRRVAEMTSNVPHPYEDGMAEHWIATLGAGYAEGAQATFAITRRDDDMLVGAVGLRIDRSSREAELGYWTGAPFWNRGYATEAAKALLGFGFRELALTAITAAHLARNPASGRVMQKAGMRREGTVRRSTRTAGEYEDLIAYRIRREDWLGE
ncbi:MAG TPA: GNAT family N-acetyltransferase [Woeseiaceae bacterium]|nr:GNAT family N-acetyltransferase [Woeseiaceae bacterium]